MSGDPDDATAILDSTAIEIPEGKRSRAYLIVLAGSNVGAMQPIDQELTLGRGTGVGLRLQDEGISRVHCKITQNSFGDVYVEDLGSSNGTFCNGERIDRQILADGDKIQIGRTAILKFTYHDQLDETFQRQMLDSALRDSLTRAYNKRYFTDRLDAEIRFAQRHQTALSLLLFDIDHFKKINDTFGHLAGDAALIAFATHLQNSIRNEDVFARFGGEEFAIISRGIPRHAAKTFAERLRREIAALSIETDNGLVSITTSIGIATLPENHAENPDEMVKAADTALYQAKQTGRNRVILCEPGGDGGETPGGSETPDA